MESVRSPKCNHLFLGPLSTFPENYRKCRLTDRQINASCHTASKKSPTPPKTNNKQQCDSVLDRNLKVRWECEHSGDSPGRTADWLVNHRKCRFRAKLLGKLTSAVNSFLLGKAEELHSTANGFCRKTHNIMASVEPLWPSAWSWSCWTVQIWQQGQLTN